MKLIKLISLAVTVLSCNTLVAQQPVTYTQYMNNLTPFNAAYSALDSAGSVTGLVRKQWMGIEGSPTTFLFNGSAPLSAINSHVGLIIGNDETGIEKQFDAQAFFAKTVCLDEIMNLTVSVNAGVRRLSANYSQLDAFDPKFRENVNDTKGVFGLGIMFHSTNYYLGVSAPQISFKGQGSNSVTSGQPLNTYYFAGGYLFNINSDLQLKPAALLSYSDNQRFQSDISATAYIKEILGVGLNYKNSNEVAGLLSVYFRNNIRLGYSYQFGGGQGRIANGTQELMLNYRFGNNRSKKQLL